MAGAYIYGSDIFHDAVEFLPGSGQISKPPLPVGVFSYVLAERRVVLSRLDGILKMTEKTRYIQGSQTANWPRQTCHLGQVRGIPLGDNASFLFCMRAAESDVETNLEKIKGG